MVMNSNTFNQKTMKKISPALASMVNAIALLVLGTWGYFASSDQPITAFIPVVFGVILLVLNNGVKKENKMIAHIAVVLTALILIGLIKPLTSAIGDGRMAAVGRVGIMILTTVFALAMFVKNFIDARKNKSET